MKLCYSIADVVALTGFSRSFVYDEIRDGRLPAQKKRRRRIILHEDLMNWLRGHSGIAPKSTRCNPSEFEIANGVAGVE